MFQSNEVTRVKVLLKVCSAVSEEASTAHPPRSASLTPDRRCPSVTALLPTERGRDVGLFFTMRGTTTCRPQSA